MTLLLPSTVPFEEVVEEVGVVVVVVVVVVAAEAVEYHLLEDKAPSCNRQSSLLLGSNKVMNTLPSSMVKVKKPNSSSTNSKATYDTIQT